MASISTAVSYASSKSFLNQNSSESFFSSTHLRSPPPQMVSIRNNHVRIKCSKAAAQWLSTPEKSSNTEAKAFDASMVGVKGLVDSGLKKIPPFFIHQDLKNENKSSNKSKKSEVPLIDIEVDGASENPNACW